MGNASQINRYRNSVRVERRSDLNESDLGEVYCMYSSNACCIIMLLNVQLTYKYECIYIVYHNEHCFLTHEWLSIEM